MIVVDTTVSVDDFRGVVTTQSDKLDTLLGVEQVLIGDLILAEVLQGFASDRDFNRARKLLASVPLIPLGGEDIAFQAAKNFRRLRTLGITIRKTIDTLIATSCIEMELSLLYSDRDFAFRSTSRTSLGELSGHGGVAAGIGGILRTTSSGCGNEIPSGP